MTIVYVDCILKFLILNSASLWPTYTRRSAPFSARCFSARCFSARCFSARCFYDRCFSATVNSHQKPAFSQLAVFLLAVFLLAVFQQKSNIFDFSFFYARSHSDVKSLAVSQLDQLTPRIHLSCFSAPKQRAVKQLAVLQLDQLTKFICAVFLRRNSEQKNIELKKSIIDSHRPLSSAAVKKQL